jgi:membrane dipeptidase
MKRNGGVVQVVAFNSYVKCDRATVEGRAAAQAAVRAEFGIPAGNPRVVAEAVDALPPARRTAYEAALREIRVRFPPATVRDFVDHIDYIVKRIGLDHVGISSDFDGGGGVDGWSDASETFSVTFELVRRGYTEAQVAQLWSGNLLRVLDEVQAVAARLRRSAR